MTREEYIEFANALKNNYTIDFDKLPEFCDMAISVLPDSVDNKTNGEIIKAMFPNGYELDIKRHQYVAWVAKNKTDFSFEVSENFWKAKHEGGE